MEGSGILSLFLSPSAGDGGAVEEGVGEEAQSPCFYASEKTLGVADTW